MNGLLYPIARKMRSSEPGRRTLKQLYRFVCVGIINTIIGYGTFFIVQIYINYLVALVISHVVGVSISYVWNRLWTFQSNNSKVWEFLRFESTYLVSLIVNMVLLYAAVDIMGQDPRIVQLLLLPVITVFTFIGHKYWSFNSR